MSKRRKGILITFEGTEGAGKSTLIRAVADCLKSEGHSPVITREPGGNSISEKIRKLILEEEMDPWTELFLYEAARSEHMAKTIRPALEADEVVLCDRFTDSSLAYQAHARGLPWKDVKKLNSTATGGRTPDLTILLDIDPATGLKRARDRNRFEAEGVEFQKRVRSGFLKARAESPSRWLTIRADSGNPQELAAEVQRALRKRFRRFSNGKAKKNG